MELGGRNTKHWLPWLVGMPYETCHAAVRVLLPPPLLLVMQQYVFFSHAVVRVLLSLAANTPLATTARASPRTTHHAVEPLFDENLQLSRSAIGIQDFAGGCVVFQSFYACLVIPSLTEPIITLTLPNTTASAWLRSVSLWAASLTDSQSSRHGAPPPPPPPLLLSTRTSAFPSLANGGAVVSLADSQRPMPGARC
jgi:hypothetical protein